MSINDFAGDVAVTAGSLLAVATLAAFFGWCPL